jgi:RHO1 GDP-GTP exchange protein 1/2
MRRVLHLKMVTQCAMLEDFGIFLVLADKVCNGGCADSIH